MIIQGRRIRVGITMVNTTSSSTGDGMFLRCRNSHSSLNYERNEDRNDVFFQCCWHHPC